MGGSGESKVVGEDHSGKQEGVLMEEVPGGAWRWAIA